MAVTTFSGFFLLRSVLEREVVEVKVVESGVIDSGVELVTEEKRQTFVSVVPPSNECYEVATTTEQMSMGTMLCFDQATVSKREREREREIQQQKIFYS